MRTRLAAVLTAAVLLVFAAPANTAEPVHGKPTVSKTFDVADLVIPVTDFGDDPGPISPRRQREAVAEGADRLIKLVTSLVRPNGWTTMGGTGTVEFFETGNSIVVRNSAEAVAEVADLLQAMRRLQAVSVVTEVRLVKVPAWFYEGFGVKRDRDAGLTEGDLKRFLDAAQSDSEANVMLFPKITTFDNQSATVRAGERRMFATGAEVVKAKGQPVLVPKQKLVDLGDTLTVRGTVSADRKSVNLRAKLSRTTVVGDVERVPVTLTIRPLFEDGHRGQPIPFTQFLEAPEFRTQSAERTVVVPDGGTVVIGGWCESGRSAPMPVLTKIPYANKLFKTVGETKEYEVVVLATTRIVRADAECPIAPMPVESKR